MTQTEKLSRHLITLYTRTPLHVGTGDSVDVIDLPIARERITGFPVIPSTSFKGVLRDETRRTQSEANARILFGEDRPAGSETGITSHAGCLQIMEAKILAFPVRSLAGCFSWLTCPAVLRRFHRDTQRQLTFPGTLDPDHVIAGSALVVHGRNGDEVVLEEYSLKVQGGSTHTAASSLAEQLIPLSTDPLWKESLGKRLAIVHDENFQHFVTTCTEVVARIKIDPSTRTTSGGALFQQENVPCEALFYSVVTQIPSRKPQGTEDPEAMFSKLLSDTCLLQLGGDETTGHGICGLHHTKLNAEETSK